MVLTQASPSIITAQAPQQIAQFDAPALAPERRLMSDATGLNSSSSAHDTASDEGEDHIAGETAGLPTRTI